MTKFAQEFLCILFPAPGLPGFEKEADNGQTNYCIRKDIHHKVSQSQPVKTTGFCFIQFHDEQLHQME
jgi:hypothetical protein